MGWVKILQSRAFYGNFCKDLELLTNFVVVSVFWWIYSLTIGNKVVLKTEYRHTGTLEYSLNIGKQSASEGLLDKKRAGRNMQDNKKPTQVGKKTEEKQDEGH